MAQRRARGARPLPRAVSRPGGARWRGSLQARPACVLRAGVCGAADVSCAELARSLHARLRGACCRAALRGALARALARRSLRCRQVIARARLLRLLAPDVRSSVVRRAVARGGARGGCARLPHRAAAASALTHTRSPFNPSFARAPAAKLRPRLVVDGVEVPLSVLHTTNEQARTPCAAYALCRARLPRDKRMRWG